MTVILVIGIRESATSNTAMVLVKLGVVLFVIAIGIGYVNTPNWTDIPVEARRQPEEAAIPGRGRRPTSSRHRKDADREQPGTTGSSN